MLSAIEISAVTSAAGIASAYPAGSIAGKAGSAGESTSFAGSLVRKSGDAFEKSSAASGNQSYDAKGKKTGAAAGSKKSSGELSSDEQKEVQKLQSADREVKAHEEAHITAGGSLVRGGASFSYSRGPDGKDYAVAGEVQIDSSEVPDNLRATISKMQQVRAAALAPKNPSGQDRAVASSASAAESKARAELAAKTSENIASPDAAAAGNEAGGAKSTMPSPAVSKAVESYVAAEVSYVPHSDTLKNITGSIGKKLEITV